MTSWRSSVVGKPRIEIPVDIVGNLLTFLGPTGTPALAAGTTLAAFEFLERISSNGAREALKNELKEFDPNKMGVLPFITTELFQRVFGSRHLSGQCIFRSFWFSIGGALFFFCLALALNPDDILDMWNFYEDEPARSLWLLWPILSTIPDYVNLYKTRVLLIFSVIERLGAVFLSVIVVLDILVGFLVFYILYNVSFSVAFSVAMQENMAHVLQSSLGNFYRTSQIVSHYFGLRSFESILFYAGMLPSMWLWMYAVAVLVARTALSSEGMLKRILWFLDVEQHPIRSLGVISAVLVFIAFSLILGFAAIFAVARGED